MKKNIYSLLTMLVLTLSFMACSDDNKSDYGTHATKPEVVAAGTYQGTWTIEATIDNKLKQLTADGTVSLVAAETPYLATLTTTAGAKNDGDLTVDTKTACGDAIVNMAWYNDNIRIATGYVIDDANVGTLAAKVSGEINDGVVTILFSKNVRSGRSSTTYFYKFVGKK